MLKSKSKTEKLRKQARKRAEHTKGDVVERLAPHVEAARHRAAPYVADAKVKAADARVKAAPYVAEAREKAAPYVTEARERTAPVVEGARTKLATEVLPVLTAAVAAASEATEDAREEARRRGLATAAALKGEVEAPKRKESHKLRNFLLLLGLGGIAAFVAKQLSDRQASTAWKSSYEPTSTAGASTTSGAGMAATAGVGTSATSPSYSSPGVAAPAEDTPVGNAAAAAAGAHDEGGAGPDEAAADAEERPHGTTTPDHPADEVRLDDDR